MDMDPINKKMKMKKVAGFHPFCTLVFLPSPAAERDRSGLGTRDFQKDVSATELRGRVARADASGVLGRRS
jgi:hypothetical protein